MKRLLGWGLILVFLTSLGMGTAACSHTNNGSDMSETEDSTPSQKRVKRARR